MASKGGNFYGDREFTTLGSEKTLGSLAVAGGRVHQHLQQGRTVGAVADEEAKIPSETEVQGEEHKATEL